ncbi:1,5-anhydro-D-fructose reductase [Rubripirellula lacrimiformis]|uniref:1,5-anhydro-D-fructose reductase n=1 Tax=Rubripirellula lacrimiformis TaxID=1930273 RepID=A0A517NKS9_9BACT|nr:Gfo/Idh/MocA family oxidoreductase [Rubripirellula lacrimiformis]QDT07745.1 1,5-anhydro-D-fructose reductase [Rubripirellula lacrimiformis]
MNTQPCAAVVGTGFIGPVHVEALKRAGVQVTGILGSSPAKSVAAAQSLGLPRGYQSFDEVLADETVDAVHLTTPNRFHFEQAAACLRSGKHVMCEKPLAMNSAQSQELVQLARQSGLAAGVAYNIRFYPLCHEAAARARTADFGDCLHITGSYVQDWLLKPTDYNWRVIAEDGGELRAVADIGTHWLDLVQFVTGLHVQSVCADLQTVHATRQRPTGETRSFSHSNDAATHPVSITTEDAGCILLKFSDLSRGSLHVSQTTAGRKNCLRFEIAGSGQSLAWDSQQPNSLWIGHRDRPSETLIRDPALMSPSAAQVTSYPGGHNEGFPDTFKQLFRTFYASIEAHDFGPSQKYPMFIDGHREILLCEAILQSHRQQAWVDVDRFED